jgi:hypothetical protein
MTNFVFHFSAFAVENRGPLTCVWVETGNPRQPLACRWVAGPAEPVHLQSEQAPVDEKQRLLIPFPTESRRAKAAAPVTHDDSLVGLG